MPKQENERLNPDDFQEELSEVETDVNESGNSEAKVDANDTQLTSENEELAKVKEDEEVRKRNAEQAAKRRKAEEEAKRKREEQIKRQAQLDTKLGIYKTNTYTNEPIRDEEDLKVFEMMKELEDEGKDPINDFPSKVIELRRKAKQEQEEKEITTKQEKEKISKDIADFQKKYPKVDLTELADNQEFMNLTKGKVGRWTLEEMYLLFQKEQEEKAKVLKEKKEQEAIDKVVENATTPPKPKGNNGNAERNPLDNPKTREEREKWKKYFNEKYS